MGLGGVLGVRDVNSGAENVNLGTGVKILGPF